jgi:hypothetical protein
MNDNDHTTVAMPAFKIFTAWLAALGLQSWGDFASFLAACYTLLLIGEWFFKKIKGTQQKGDK